MHQKQLELPQSPGNQTTSKISKTELKRLQKLHKYENAARQQGFSIIAGIDEAGRGPLAGPVVAAACIIPEGVYVVGVDDSKKLLPKKRQEIFERIMSDNRILFGVGIVSHEEIDSINIYQATIKAMLLAIEKLSIKPDVLLVDGMNLLHPVIPSQKIVQGDGLSHSIAAASIIAKQTRDQLMCQEHEKWPEYGFVRHKGYGTEEHLAAIAKHGPCPIHRLSFSPFRVVEEEAVEIE